MECLDQQRQNGANGEETPNIVNSGEILDIVQFEESDRENLKGNDEDVTPSTDQQTLEGNDEVAAPSIEHWEEGGSDGIPRIGMKFSSEDEAYDFYNAYAARVGFSIRRGAIRHNTRGIVRQRNFVCSKEGLKVDYGICEVQKTNRLETRTYCKATIRLTVTNGVWEVTRFDPDHNHELAEPSQRRFLRSTRRLFEDSPISSIANISTLLYNGVGESCTVPTIGMKVYSEDEAYSLYNLYAMQVGFSIRKGGYRHNSRGELRQRNYVCSKQGLRLDDEPDRVRKVNRLETRTDCKASIRFTITDGVWEVTYFNAEHNHEPVEPEQRKYLRSNRKLSLPSAGLITSPSNSIIKPIKTDSCLTEEVGGDSNIQFPSLSSHKLLKTKGLCLIEAEDAQSVFNYFKHKQAEDTMFFYAMRVDGDNRVTNFFWRDGRSRMDYDCFGDVVIFGTSSQTNEYNLVCAPFVGVNHHGKNVLFGCAILLDETISSYTWLFETFSESMGNRHPKTIFTSQCQAMENAIAKVLPRTCHRLNIWHIQESSAQHLSNLHANPEFRMKLNKCLTGCRTDVEFQSAWDELIVGFGLAENEWLKTLYDQQQKWCPIFSLDTFSADMTSSQRSDRTKKVFNQILCKPMTIAQFVHQYEETADEMRLAELEEDCNQGLPTRASRNSAMLKQAADVYTVEIFKLFQEEMVESLSIVMNELSSDGSLHTYELTEEENKGGYTVHFNSDNCTAICSCKMFESMGLLCRHALRVLNMRNVTKIPTKYILKRWTKLARKGVIFLEAGESSSNNAKETRSLLRRRLMHKAFFAVEKSLMSTTGSEIADSLLDKIIEQAERQIATLNAINIENEDSESAHDGAVDDTTNKSSTVCSQPASDPSHARSKGQFQKKQKRKASNSIFPPGKEKLQSVIGPSGALFHPPQITTFFRPTFQPAIVGIDVRSYNLSNIHQGHFPTWVLSNFHPTGMPQGTDQVPDASQDSSTSFDANHTQVPQLDQANGSS